MTSNAEDTYKINYPVFFLMCCASSSLIKNKVPDIYC